MLRRAKRAACASTLKPCSAGVARSLPAMSKRASEAREARPKRRRAEGGQHQRHRTRISSVLAMPGATGVFVSCARGKERKAALELMDMLNEVRAHSHRSMPHTSTHPP